MKETKIINLFGGPGVGKSTIASGIFYNLKKRHVECDCPYEFPKQVAWEDNQSQITDQLYILANQHRGIVRSYGKVDYIILDSPILLSLAYKDGYDSPYPSSHYSCSFDIMVLELFSKYDNLNIFLERDENSFQQTGRLQNHEESLFFDEKIKSILDNNNFPYYTYKVGDNTVDELTEFIIKKNET